MPAGFFAEYPHPALTADLVNLDSSVFLLPEFPGGQGEPCVQCCEARQEVPVQAMPVILASPQSRSGFRRPAAHARRAPLGRSWLTLDDVAHVRASKATRAKEYKEHEHKVELEAEAAVNPKPDPEEEEDQKERDFFGNTEVPARTDEPIRVKPSPELQKFRATLEKPVKTAGTSVAHIRGKPNSAYSRQHLYLANRLSSVPTKKAVRYILPPGMA